MDTSSGDTHHTGDNDHTGDTGQAGYADTYSRRGSGGPPSNPAPANPGASFSAAPGAALPPVPAATGYAVERLLGVGASGAVWLVRNDAGKRFALKVPAGAGHGAFEARREVNVLARLEHPHLVPLHGVAETDQGDGLVAGYAAGGSVGALVAARGPVKPGEAVTVLVGIANALAYLHARGAAHGDVSPANILFTAAGKPQLADFGQARLLGEPGTPAPGTPGFEAPEAGRADAGGRGSSLGAAGDIYALAAVGWFLLTGKVPPPARDRPPLSILVPGVGRELPALLEAALAEDPEARPSAGETAAWAYRSAAALPVDLVASAHPDARPELLTRRTGSAGGEMRRRRGPGRGRSGINRRGTGSADGQGEREARRRDAGRNRRRHRHGGRATGDAVGQGPRRDGWRKQGLGIAATVLVLSVLVLAGIALAAPGLLRAEPERSTGPAARPAASSAAAGPGSGTPAAAPTKGTADPASPPGSFPGDNVPEVSAQVPPVSSASVEALVTRSGAADPAEALPALAELRARAFSSADLELLDYANAPDSDALLADREQVERLLRDGRRFRGLNLVATVLSEVPELLEAPDAASRGNLGNGSAASAGTTQTPLRAVPLRVRLNVAPYQQVDAAGTVVAEERAQEQEVVLELVQSEGTWKISRVLGPE